MPDPDAPDERSPVTLTDPPDDLPTFAPARGLVQHGDRVVALDYLIVRTGLKMHEAYRDHTDPRHEHAVLAVDVASRLIWLHAQVQEAALTGVAELGSLAHRAQARQSSRGSGPDEMVVSPVVERLPQLTARVTELEYVLNLVAAAFKAAWHNDVARNGRAESTV